LGEDSLTSGVVRLTIYPSPNRVTDYDMNQGTYGGKCCALKVLRIFPTQSVRDQLQNVNHVFRISEIDS
jgi:hypothetical protein